MYGDKIDFVLADDFLFPDGGDRLPLIEYPETFNKYDGDDIIDVGNNNMLVKAFGQGANNKIIGGYGED